MLNLDKFLTLKTIKINNWWGEKSLIQEAKPLNSLPLHTIASEYRKEDTDRFIIRKNHIVSKKDHVVADSIFERYFFVQRIPDDIDPFIWAEMLSLNDVNVEIVHKLKPLDSYQKSNDLRANLRVLAAQIAEAKSENYDVDVLNELLHKNKESLRLLETGTEKAYIERFFLVVKSNSKKELDISSKYLDKFLRGKNILIKRLDNLQFDAFRESLPIGTFDSTIPGRQILSRTVRQRYMLVKPQARININANIYGYDNTNLPHFLDRWEECPAAHQLITGATGSGKSVLAKTLFMEDVDKMIDPRTGEITGKIVIIDPNREYLELGKHILKAIPVELSPGSDVRLNVFDCLDLTRTEKISQLESELPLLLGAEQDGKLSTGQWDAARRALIKCYNKKGVGIDYHISKGYKRQPTFNDIFIQAHYDRAEASPEQRKSYDALITRLSKFVDVNETIEVPTKDGKMRTIKLEEYGQYAFMSEETRNIDMINLDRMVFSVQGVEKSVKSAYMYLVMDTIWRRMQKNREDPNAPRFLILLDEAHMILDNPITRANINELYAIARKYNTSITSISQRISTYMENGGEGSSILANSHSKIFLAQDDVEASKIGKLYSLEHEDVERLQTLGMGEFLMVVKGSGYKYKRFLRNIVFDKGIELFETNPAKIKKIKEKHEKQRAYLYSIYEKRMSEIFADYFNNKHAYKTFKALQKESNLVESKQKALKQYQAAAERFHAKALSSESEMVMYNYLQYLDSVDKSIEEDIPVPKEDVSPAEVLTNPKMYYLVDNLDDKTIENLTEQGYINVMYPVGDRTYSFYTHIRTHVKHRPISQKEASYYGSPKKRALLDIDTKHALDHHMMQVHAHSLLVQYVKDEEIKFYDTVEADIVYPGPDGNKCAIEAESGSQKLQEKDIKHKIELNDEKYKDRWIIYVPTAADVQAYANYMLKHSKHVKDINQAKERVLYRTKIGPYLSQVFGSSEIQKEED